MALVGSGIAMALAAAFVISAVGLLRRRQWARQLFVVASIGVLAFMLVSAFHYFDVTQAFHISYGLGLLIGGYWFLFRSKAAAAFGT